MKQHSSRFVRSFKRCTSNRWGAIIPPPGRARPKGAVFSHTAIGHDARVFNTDFGRQHLLASLQWAAGETE